MGRRPLQPPGGEPHASPLPARQFPALAGRDPDIGVQTEASATDGTEVVAATRIVADGPQQCFGLVTHAPTARAAIC